MYGEIHTDLDDHLNVYWSHCKSFKLKVLGVILNQTIKQSKAILSQIHGY